MSIACKKGLIRDTSPDPFSPAGASLGFLPFLCQLLQLISFLTAKLYQQYTSQPAGQKVSSDTSRCFQPYQKITRTCWTISVLDQLTQT